ncbi:MAG: site-2 protease family protein [Planctomycetota bacterium]
MELLLRQGLTSGLTVLAVILAFSLLIFVHELGHFLAALLAGVRVEKFMLGFDVWGWGLRRKFRGVEYGLGALPIGGYVKLAGQSDLPGEEELTGAPDELASKGLPARALVFTAGVAMNFLLGFALLVGAQLYGVPRPINVLGPLEEASPAERAGLRAGDRIVAADGSPIQWFKDIAEKVVLSEGKPLRLTIERRGARALFDVLVYPEPGEGRIPWQIGVIPSFSRTVAGYLPLSDATSEKEKAALQDLPRSLPVGARVIAVNGIPIEHDYEGGRIVDLVKNRPGQEAVLRVESPLEGGAWSEAREIRAPLYPAGLYTEAGFRFSLEVKRVLDGSAARAAGLEAGDAIGAVDGEYFHQPGAREFSRRLNEAAFSPIEVRVRRSGAEATVRIEPRPMTGDPRIPPGEDNFLGVLLEERPNGRGPFRVREVLNPTLALGPEGLQPGDELLRLGGRPLQPNLGLAEQVNLAGAQDVSVLLLRAGEERTVRLKPRVDPTIGLARIGVLLTSEARLYGVDPGSPAERHALGRGDRITRFSLSLDLKTTAMAWLARGETKARALVLFETPRAVVEDPVVSGLRGELPLAFEGHFARQRAPSLWAAVAQGGSEALGMTTTVYQVFKKLVMGRLNLTAAGGPIMIFQVMYRSAELGWPHLVDLVALISINLAVLNLLPIPVLDGGHLLFLLIEWIKGSRPNARVVEIAQYAGFLCLLGLMAIVTAFDLYYSFFAGSG